MIETINCIVTTNNHQVENIRGALTFEQRKAWLTQISLKKKEWENNYGEQGINWDINEIYIPKFSDPRSITFYTKDIDNG